MRHESEPSVEEILESIKKVIARDNRDQADALRRKREADGPGPVANTSAPGFGATVFSAPYTLGEEEGEDVLDLSAMDFADDAPEATATPDLAPALDLAQGLTNDQAADAMRQSLAALAMLAEPAAAPRIVRSGETSLEGLVREMLRPMMAQWLDAHLPEIVERLVKAEIARIAGKKR
jgi:uncharacterized protein